MLGLIISQRKVRCLINLIISLQAYDVPSPACSLTLAGRLETLGKMRKNRVPKMALISFFFMIEYFLIKNYCCKDLKLKFKIKDSRF
jgi:hypothetical protein